MIRLLGFPILSLVFVLMYADMVAHYVGNH